MLLKYKRLMSKKATRLYHKRGSQAFRNAGPFQCDIGRQPVAVGRVTFARDQGQQVPPAGGGDSKAIGSNEIARQLFLLIGNGGERRFANAPAIGFRGLSDDDRHHRVPALQRQLDRRLADGIRLIDVDLGCNVPRRALQIIGYRPMELVAKGLLRHLRHDGSDAAQLGMAERVLGPGLGEEFAFGVLNAFRDHDDAVAALLDGGFHLVQEGLAIEGDFGEKYDVGRLAGLVSSQTAGRRDPARVPAHHLEDENLGRGAGHRAYVKPRFARRHATVLGDGAEPRAAIRDGQIIVHGLGYPDANDGKVHLHGDLGHFLRRVHGVVAAVVKEVTDVVRAEYVDQSRVLRAVLVDSGQLVARRAECAAWRVTQAADGGPAFLADIDHILGQRADDAVPAGIDFADFVGMATRRFA